MDPSRLTAQKRALEALKKVREQSVDKASRALASAVRAAQSASRAHRSAEEAAEAHAQRVASVAEAEAQGLRRGKLRAGELAEAAAYGRRADLERDALAAAASRAKDQAVHAENAEDRARADLLARKVDEEVIVRAVSRSDAEEQKASEMRAERAASEAWRPRG